jgi:hypothetical protein
MPAEALLGVLPIRAADLAQPLAVVTLTRVEIPADTAETLAEVILIIRAAVPAQPLAVVALSKVIPTDTLLGVLLPRAADLAQPLAVVILIIRAAVPAQPLVVVALSEVDIPADTEETMAVVVLTWVGIPAATMAEVVLIIRAAVPAETTAGMTFTRVGTPAETMVEVDLLKASAIREVVPMRAAIPVQTSLAEAALTQADSLIRVEIPGQLFMAEETLVKAKIVAETLAAEVVLLIVAIVVDASTVEMVLFRAASAAEAVLIAMIEAVEVALEAGALRSMGLPCPRPLCHIVDRLPFGQMILLQQLMSASSGPSISMMRQPNLTTAIRPARCRRTISQSRRLCSKTSRRVCRPDPLESVPD